MSSRKAESISSTCKRERDDLSSGSSRYQPISKIMDYYIHISVGLFCTLQITQFLPDVFSIQGVGWVAGAFGLGILVGAIIVVAGLVGVCWIFSRPFKLTDVYTRSPRTRKPKQVRFLLRRKRNDPGESNIVEQKLKILEQRNVPNIQVPQNKPSPPNDKGVRLLPQKSLPLRYSRNGEYQGWLYTVKHSRWDEELHLPQFPPATDGSSKIATVWYAALRAGNIILKDPDGSDDKQVVIPLDECSVRVVKACLRAKPQWWKKGPLELRHPYRHLLHGESALFLFAASSYDKQQWYRAIKFCCDQLNMAQAADATNLVGYKGPQASTELQYRQYCVYVRKRAPIRFPRVKDEQPVHVQVPVQPQQTKKRRWRFRFGRNQASQNVTEEKVNQEAQRKHSDQSLSQASNTGNSKSRQHNRKNRRSERRNSQMLQRQNSANAVTSQSKSQQSKSKETSSLEQLKLKHTEDDFQINQVPKGRLPAVRSYPSLTPEDMDRKWMKGAQEHDPISYMMTNGVQLQENYIQIPGSQQTKQQDAQQHQVGNQPAQTGTQNHQTSQTSSELPFTDFLNMFLTRWGYDLLRSSGFQQGLSQKLQARLDEVSLPIFMTPLKVIEVNAGSMFPGITRMQARPSTTDTIWPQLEVDLVYQGDFSMIVETRYDNSKFWLCKQMVAFYQKYKGEYGEKKPTKVTEVTEEQLQKYVKQHPQEVEALSQDLQIQEQLSPTASGISNLSQEGKPKFGSAIGRLLYRHAVKITEKVTQFKYTIRLRSRLKKFKVTLLMWVPPPPGNSMFLSFIGVPQLKMETTPLDNQLVRTLAHVGQLGSMVQNQLLQGLTKAMVYPANVEIPIRGFFDVDSTQLQNPFNLPKEFAMLAVHSDDEEDDQSVQNSQSSNVLVSTNQEAIINLSPVTRQNVIKQTASSHQLQGDFDISDEEMDQDDRSNEDGDNVDYSADGQQNALYGENMVLYDKQNMKKGGKKKGKFVRMGKEAFKRLRFIKFIRRRSVRKDRLSRASAGLATPEPEPSSSLDLMVLGDDIQTAYSEGDGPNEDSLVHWEDELIPVDIRSKSVGQLSRLGNSDLADQTWDQDQG
eukprot:TRINITY_DN5588_c1_g1_i15.p1 TRINITY_DN5588_c1_g1~~TRINITY_DN5588_c1_g1_i15.p1  ORF type:complete len:1084 (-),score=92.01 TRINITY_DN5588_c1_g1_i15:644-3895(-)